MSTEPDAPRLARYKDLQLVGKGGMGAVYKGRDPVLDRKVAIKIMLHTSPDFVARFQREAQAVARLQHGNIVQVFDFGVDEDDNPYFVMELIEGTPLDRLIREHGRLLPTEAIRVARQAAEGLAAAHRAGIIHRDVKPSNLIVDGRGTVKLVDFGIARFSDGSAQLTGAAALIGTPGYMAPEQATGSAVDHRADIYALGLTLFEMLAGEAPFRGDNPMAVALQQLHDPMPDLRKYDLGVPESLVRLIEQMIAKDPDARISRCEAVIAALDEILAQVRTGVSGVNELAAPLVSGTGIGRADTPMLPGRVLPRIADEASPLARAVDTDQDHAPGTNPQRAGNATPAGTPSLVTGPRSHPIAGESVAPPTGSSPSAVARRRASSPLALGGGALLTVAALGVIGWMVLHPRAGNEPTTLHPTNPTSPTNPTPAPPTPTMAAAPSPAPAPAPAMAPATAIAPAAASKGPLRVAVLKFKNLSSERELDMLSLGIGETAVNLMSTVGSQVKLMERGDLESDIVEIDRGKDEHFDRASVARLGHLEGVELAVQGAFQRSGKRIRVTARFVRVENGEVVDTVTVDKPANDLLALQDEVAARLKTRLVALAGQRRP